MYSVEDLLGINRSIRYCCSGRGSHREIEVHAVEGRSGGVVEGRRGIVVRHLRTNVRSVEGIVEVSFKQFS